MKIGKQTTFSNKISSMKIKWVFNLPFDSAPGFKKLSSVAVTDDLTECFLVFFRRVVGLAKTLQCYLLTNLEYHLLSPYYFIFLINKHIRMYKYFGYKSTDLVLELIGKLTFSISTKSYSTVYNRLEYTIYFIDVHGTLLILWKSWKHHKNEDNN